MRYCFFFLSLLLVAGCTRRATPYDFPTPYDTADHPVDLQVKREYSFARGGLVVDNQFDAARLNGIEQVNDTLYRAIILPENTPINPSPWYALRIRTDRARDLTLRLTYPPGVRHRYFPKVSADRRRWTPVDSSRLTYNSDSTTLDVRLSLAAGTHYLAAQEVVDSRDVMDWLLSLRSPYVALDRAGTSKLGRMLPVLRISADMRYGHKPIVVLFSRQHPPEVTGYLALQAFVETLLEHPRAEALLDRYQFLVFPILNPDGVDLGHWRHTAGGIDANRDWAYYRQPEVRQVADYIVHKMRLNETKVILGLDFHSAWHDDYHTLDSDTPPSVLPGFQDAWLRGIEERIGGGFRVHESAGTISRPTSAGWFRTQFNAEGITCGIGDDTDREFVRRKGRASAEALIGELLSHPPE